MKNEPILTWKGRRVRSPDDSPEKTAKKVPSAPLRPGSLFFVPSPLEGWGVDVLLERLPAEAAVVLFEKDPALKQHCREAFEQFLGDNLADPRLLWLETDTEDAVASLFTCLPLDRLRRCEFLTLNGAWLPHADRYRQVFARLEEGLTRWWSNRITSLHLGPLWVRNLIGNLKGSRFAPVHWPDWKHETVVVLGAGVTAEQALPWLAANRNFCRILAVDTALPLLRAYSMVPDAVVCVEAQHANLRDFADWRGAPVALFADLTSFPASTRVFGGPLFWYVSEFAPVALWKRWPWEASAVPRLPALGSVGVVAAWIAWKLTQGAVVFSGLDFCFPPGKTHARGAPSLAAMASRTGRLNPFEQIGSWERPGVHWTADRKWLTTGVLEGYAGLLAERAAVQAQRTWLWAQAGVPLGLRVWPREAAVEPLPQMNELLRSRDSETEKWLAQEKARCAAILDSFERLNQAPHDELVWDTLESQLREVDYLTFSFPDPKPRRSSDWLIRAQVQVRWLLERLG